MPAQYPGYGGWLLERVRETLLDDADVMDYLNNEARRVFHTQSDNPPTGMTDAAPIVGLELVSPNTDWAGAGIGATTTFSVQATAVASMPWYKAHPEEDLQNLADAVTHRLTRGAGPHVIPLGVSTGNETEIGADEERGLAGHVTIPRRFRFRVHGIQQ